VKSTPMRGVKEFLKPDAYKQSEPPSPNSWETIPKEETQSEGLGDGGDGVPLV
jgi:hypothetical protein